MTYYQFIGQPCGSYGSYTFHKGFKYLKHGKFKNVNLGEFFFVRISTSHDPCIGELELLWSDQTSDQKLSSLRLYFLPEQTPDGRHSCHGEDEVLVASDKVVLRLDDLVSWITDEVEWNHGLLAACCEEEEEEPSLIKNHLSSKENGYKTPDEINNEKSTLCDEQKQVVDDTDTERDSALENGSSDKDKTETETETLALEKSEEEEEKDEEPAEESTPVSPSVEDVSSSTETASIPAKPEEEKEVMENGDVIDRDELKVMVLPYASYCRYKTVLKRLDGICGKWMAHNLVLALGGFINFGRKTHVLFCRDTFDHEELAHHELNVEYLAPTLKMKRKKKKSKTARSTSPGSESNTSDESKDIKPVLCNGFKQPPLKDEHDFLQRLYGLMKKRKTPIARVPHLGFKQIDLYVFYSFASKLGGYDKITMKRLWKHVYDTLGGDPGSTSAATCTRRHYEKLLLPFERFMEGLDDPKQARQHAKAQKKIKDENENDVSEGGSTTVKCEIEDTYAFTDSNHENSKDSLLIDEQLPSGDEGQMNENYSDDDSKFVWSIQRTLDGQEVEQEDMDGSKQIKPLIIQKEQNETFSEKERKWNEIRRKNALARKWVRQLRPSRGGKISGSDKLSDKEMSPSEQTATQNTQDRIKKEVKPTPVNCTKDGSKPFMIPVKHEPFDPSQKDATHHLSERLKTVPIHCDSQRPEYNKKGSYLAKVHPPPDVYMPNRSHQPKSEPLSNDRKPWCGYTKDGVYQVAPAPERYPYGHGYEMNMIRSFIKQEYKGGHQGGNGQSRPYTASGASSESSAAEIDSLDPKSNLSQRRPSVIQHTEYVTSPSQSPKLVISDSYSEPNPRDAHMTFSNNPKLLSAVSNHLAHTMTGKVNEWLSKAVPEAVACKTPCVATEKTPELHDKVMMPSSSKTPGPGTGKVPGYFGKNKTEHHSYATSSKPVREKSTTSYRVAQTVKRSASHELHPASKVTAALQKAFHPNIPPSAIANSLHPYAKASMKHDPTYASNTKNKAPYDPTHGAQPKRHKASATHIPLPPIPPRPSLLPFTRQQTYRTSPLSDIPKFTASTSSNYDSVVLDLSVKKKAPGEKAAPIKTPVATTSSGPPSDEAVCLDLSVKKKPCLTRENAIENITPPLPTSSPHPASFSSSKPIKPIPSLLTLKDLIREDAYRKKGATKPAATGSLTPSPALVSNSLMYAGSAQTKIPQSFMTSHMPDSAFAKEMAKSLYMAEPTQFPPYVISPFYAAAAAANWPNQTANSGNRKTATPSSSSSNSSTTASPNSSMYKEAMNHSVFPPKPYAYNMKHQFHPLMCKDNGYYPPSCK